MSETRLQFIPAHLEQQRSLKRRVNEQTHSATLRSPEQDFYLNSITDCLLLTVSCHMVFFVCFFVVCFFAFENPSKLQVEHLETWWAVNNC